MLPNTSPVVRCVHCLAQRPAAPGRCPECGHALKRPYTAPRIEMLGRIDELTRGGGHQSTNDNFGSASKGGPGI